jgi:GT2 family glycosyltransferase
VMWVTVGIATNGRRHILQQALNYLLSQSRPPDEVIIGTSSGIDIVPELPPGAPFPIRHVQSELGLTKQRNAIIRAAGQCDVLLFIDDDFFLCRDYIAEMIAIFESDAVAVATGTVVADGIKGPGITFEEADRIVRQEDALAHPREIHQIRQGYGCNMALRYRLLITHAEIFDENLPRYGWYEDVDLMRRLASYGQIVRSTAARGVHLGTKTGRTSGRFLGYSQVANPVYLHRKGIYAPFEAFVSIAKNFTANAARSIYPESYIDRRGRLIGNLVAMKDLVTRRIHPLNALRMDRPTPG